MKNYTVCLNILGFVCLQFLMLSCNTTSHLQQKQTVDKNFIVLKNNDTIYGEKIRLSRGYNEIGKIKIIKNTGEKIEFAYDEVYQTHEYRKGKKYYIQEFVMLTPKNPVSLTLMDVVINNGHIKLYEHDPTNWGNTLFVVSDFYHGYIRNRKQFKKFLNELEACDAFQKKYADKEHEFSNTSIKEMILFYNTHCDNR